MSNQLVLQLPGARAVLLCDERVRTEHVIGPPYPHGQVIDRFAVARSLGANLVSADTIDGLIAAVEEWGVDPVGLTRTLDAYVNGGAQDAPCRPSRSRWSSRRSTRSRCSRRSRSRSAACGSIRGGACSTVTGAAVPGLYCAGGDAGGLQGPRYVAGLALGLVFGPRAVDAVVMDHGGGEAHGP